MRLQLCCLLLVQRIVMMSASVATVELRPNATSTHFYLSIETRRNTTGHWLLTVEAWREDTMDMGRGVLQSPRQMAVLIGQHTSSSSSEEVTKLTATASVGPTSASEVKRPPPGYEHVNAIGYYKAYHTPKTWFEARATCELDGAHLIVVDSERENAVLATMFDSRPSDHSYENSNWFFTGVHDQINKGEFVTIMGWLWSMSFLRRIAVHRRPSSLYTMRRPCGLHQLERWTT